MGWGNGSGLGLGLGNESSRGLQCEVWGGFGLGLVLGIGTDWSSFLSSDEEDMALSRKRKLAGCGCGWSHDPRRLWSLEVVGLVSAKRTPCELAELPWMVTP